MKLLTRLAVNKPITTIMVFVAVLAFGVVSFQRLPVDLFPDVDPPVISVFTFYPGAAAQDVEVNVTRILEDAFSTLSGLKKINSNSITNVSTIVVEFDYEANLDEATNEIRDAIDRVRRLLPDDIEGPNIFRFNTALFPVLIMAATAEESFPMLNQLLDDELIGPLSHLPGVGAVQLRGGAIRQIRVDVDPIRLEDFNIPIARVVEAIQADNINVPAGNIKMGAMDYNLRVEGEIRNPAQFGEIVIGMVEGRLVYLRDVADVYDGLRERTITERVNAKEGVRIIVQKQADANTVLVARQVLKRVEKIKETLPPDVKIYTVIDTSEFILRSINNLGQVLLFGGGFVVLIVLIFLRKLRTTMIILLTVPFSLIVAMIYLSLSGNSLNMISLSSLAIAMGMVVDDAIVVLENINTYLNRGSRPREAAIFATNEVGLAVVATTLTVVAVFLPLAFVTGMSGVWFSQLGLIVTFTVVTSTFAALSLTPMLSSKLLRSAEKEEKQNKISRTINLRLDTFFKRLEDNYAKLLSLSLRKKGWVIILAILIFAASLFLVPRIGSEFMPQTDNGRLQITMELDVGLRLEETVQVMDRIEGLLREMYPEAIRVISSTAGVQDEGIIFGGGRQANHIASFSVQMIPLNEREKDIFRMAEELRAELNLIPGIINYNIETGGGAVGGMGGGGRPLEIRVIGHDYSQTTRIAEEITQRLRQIPGARDVENSHNVEQPELQIVLHKEEMSRLGLNTNLVANTIRQGIAGTVASQYREAGNEYDVFVRFKPEFRQSVSSLQNLLIPTPSGTGVRLMEIGAVSEFYAPDIIERINRERVITVSASTSGRPLGEITADIRAEITQMEIPPGVGIGLGGQAEDQQETFGDLMILLLLSIFLVYAVMASQFENLLYPFIIMLALPFAFSGVLIGLFLANVTLNIISFVGGIILIGIVVKNAIVLVDYINLMIQRGSPLYRAIILSGRSRLKPVLMTTLTTILAMMPLIFSTGEGSEIWRPMGVTVVSGLTLSTLITLVFVPVMYGLFNKSKK
jgi:hydrophobic/amphiphilic exporter-1 (mainly G- bacteria), HAE1 family